MPHILTRSVIDKMNEKNRDDQSERVRGRSLALDESSDFESDEENVFVNPYIDRKIGVTKKRNVFVEKRSNMKVAKKVSSLPQRV